MRTLFNFNEIKNKIFGESRCQEQSREKNKIKMEISLFFCFQIVIRMVLNLYFF